MAPRGTEHMHGFCRVHRELNAGRLGDADGQVGQWDGPPAERPRDDASDRPQQDHVSDQMSWPGMHEDILVNHWTG